MRAAKALPARSRAAYPAPARSDAVNRAYRIVLTTTNSRDNVNAIVGSVLAKKLAACIQVFPIESHYWWQGRVNDDREFLLLLKAKAADYADLEAAIRSVHAYEAPEVVSLKVDEGSSKYLDWIDAVTR
jgi:periplasmic divalent cation tolerance protein